MTTGLGLQRIETTLLWSISLRFVRGLISDQQAVLRAPIGFRSRYPMAVLPSPLTLWQLGDFLR